MIIDEMNTYLLRSTSHVGFSGIAFETSADSEFGSLRVDAELDGRKEERGLVDEVVGGVVVVRGG